MLTFPVPAALRGTLLAEQISQAVGVPVALRVTVIDGAEVLVVDGDDLDEQTVGDVVRAHVPPPPPPDPRLVAAQKVASVPAGPIKAALEAVLAAL